MGAELTRMSPKQSRGSVPPNSQAKQWQRANDAMPFHAVSTVILKLTLI